VTRSATRVRCPGGAVSGRRRAGSRTHVPSVQVRQLRERLPARPDSIAPLRRAAVRFARDHGANADQRDDVALAVSEALTSSVLHAYVGHAAAGTIELRASRSRCALVIVVCDHGNGLRTRLDSRELGVGLALIERVTDCLEIEQTAPGLLIRMTFALA
jgi:serine/threonine-protein kinase RsbW